MDGGAVVVLLLAGTVAVLRLVDAVDGVAGSGDNLVVSGLRARGSGSSWNLAVGSGEGSVGGVSGAEMVTEGTSGGGRSASHRLSISSKVTSTVGEEAYSHVLALEAFRGAKVRDSHAVIILSKSSGSMIFVRFS